MLVGLIVPTRVAGSLLSTLSTKSKCINASRRAAFYFVKLRAVRARKVSGIFWSWKAILSSVNELYAVQKNAIPSFVSPAASLKTSPRLVESQLWAAVFTFNPYLLISINELMISIIHLLISINELLISINDLLISINDLLISINDLLISINELLISINELLISINTSSSTVFIDINNSFIDINKGIIDINNAFIDINKYGWRCHIY